MTPPPQSGITRQSFDQLLSLFNEDKTAAGREYMVLRGKLVVFFENRNCAYPEDYADETIFRVVKRLSEGEVIHTDSPAKYFLGIAYNLLKEYWRKLEASPQVLDDLPPDRQPALDPKRIEARMEEQDERERYLERLNQCLSEFSPENRELVLEYYRDDGEGGIEKRKSLAEKLGIQLNNLRIRVHRLREKLESCVRQGLEKEGL